VWIQLCVWRIVHSVVLRWETRVWDVGLTASCAETAKCVSKAILLTSVKTNFIFLTLLKQQIVCSYCVLFSQPCHVFSEERNKIGNVRVNIFWRVRVTIASNETQQRVVFILLSYMSLSVNTEHCKTARSCIIYVAGNNINLFRSSCKVPAISCLILTKFWSLWIAFRKNPQYQIMRKSVHWEPPWCVPTDGRTWRS